MLYKKINKKKKLVKKLVYFFFHYDHDSVSYQRKKSRFYVVVPEDNCRLILKLW